ncbi:MAG TPA: hypothetical protein PLG17_01855 [Thermodesulfobacteriota bacterium]|nr:hypothetical protein [Thermodesulfobacteriota bacterium]HQO77236.1 hypothetical protein [Thermodesulfobacteriota bacterium]
MFNKTVLPACQFLPGARGLQEALAIGRTTATRAKKGSHLKNSSKQAGNKSEWQGDDVSYDVQGSTQDAATIIVIFNRRFFFDNHSFVAGFICVCRALIARNNCSFWFACRLLVGEPDTKRQGSHEQSQKKKVGIEKQSYFFLLSHCDCSVRLKKSFGHQYRSRQSEAEWGKHSIFALEPR